MSRYLSWSKRVIQILDSEMSLAEIIKRVEYTQPSKTLAAVMCQLVERGLVYKRKSTQPGNINIYSLIPVEVENVEQTTRVCTRCNVEKPLISKYWYWQKRNDTGNWMGICKKCRRSEVARKCRENVRDRENAAIDKHIPGRLSEHKTPNGRIVMFGDDWRTDLHRHTDIGMMGYQSALARIE